MVKVVLDVPKIKQLKNYCVPASLVMIFQYYGYNKTQENIAEWFGYDVSYCGVKRFDVSKCLREYGFIANPRYGMNLDSIVKAIDKGSPIIAVTM